LDAWLIDQRCLPDDNGDYFTERDLVGLPIGFCLEGYNLTRKQSALPALNNGFITFGTLNNPNKWCPQTLANWAALLQDNPTAKLLLGRPECDKPLFVQQWQNRFAAQGIDADRLIFAGNPKGGYLELYERIDIAVDTYGNTGGMTSLEALACGVPVLSMGHPVGARQPVNLLSTAILQHVGLADEWLVDNVEALVAKATRYSNDLQSLAALRQTLPQQLTNSALYNGRAYAGGLSDALIALADRCRVAENTRHQTRAMGSSGR
jgi:predicted O-linked N-acetylglucosamine transferase (SPINDLY family)